MMRRVVAIISAAMLAFAAPAVALAQNAPPAQGGQQYGAQSSGGQPVDQSGLTAFGQDAPPPQNTDNTQFLLLGGLALGGGALIAVLATQNKSNNENPASP
jgi:hypothetical protein